MGIVYPMFVMVVLTFLVGIALGICRVVAVKTG